MSWPTILLVALGLAAAGAVAYWQLIIAEGVYLGQPLVTWLYDLTAPRYDRIKQFNTLFETRFLGRPLAAELRNRPSPFVLDIATGSGRLPLTLLAQPGFHGRIIGLDVSRPMLEQAAANLSGYHQVELIWRDARHLPFPDGCFDAVTMLEMLEFTPSPTAQLREAVRVLRPGGLLLTTRRRGLDARLMPGKTFSKAAFERLLGDIGMVSIAIEVWQVDYDLVWARRTGNSGGGARPLVEVLRCPACGASNLAQDDHTLRCESCGREYPISDGIIDLHR